MSRRALWGPGCRPLLEKIIPYALEKVDPRRLITDNLRLEKNRLHIKDRRFDLDRFDKLHVIGAGKGAPFLFEGLDNLLGSRIGGGIIVSLEEHAFVHDRVEFHAGSHPIPDRRSLEAGQAVSRYIETRVGERDLVFFLITGGASAVMVQPVPGIELEDKVEMNRLLLASGAEIEEINCVRKHMSALKGGKLAQLVYPARLISLILSDIVDSPLGAIGSGPSIPDAAPLSGAADVLRKYDLMDKLRPALRDFFRQPDKETNASPGKDLTGNVHFLVGDNRAALGAARERAEAMGIRAHILTAGDKGEASEAAKIYAAVVKEIIYNGNPFKPPVLLLSGGELTVTLKPPPGQEPGKGGRNQAFALYMLKELQHVAHPFCVVSVGTDGLDGLTDAAGARIDDETIRKVNERGLDMNHYLRNYDSYHFFQQIDQLIKTGPTRTNVMDLRMFYIL
jgi:glycerate 2-kinase